MNQKKIDPMCINSMKKNEPCPICSGTAGSPKVHNKAEFENLGYVFEEKKDVE